ncbi:hypothetical protein A3D68_00380 [Candidatus Adlerbacteria bacterium RIFCSPHIGHO2_02_FULL_52_17]|uniref:Uncharacterized protein n=1 Tax=Candidatus Adlerbacteria bacterium RIFCSPHIGHO2_02_FULL_52_17 TaxID=1797240 RepID=A0A1F4XPQ2_9BACT|nr:MAG: hypothetical protein A3D68_00380 [Candidatus Adlerbacteria bacterium RIFCSPHIGHO2_02_FULL_52_17]
MVYFKKIFMLAALIGVMGVPFVASAFGTSFGGRIISVIPCSGGMRHITIIPAGVFPISYIWTPFTITYSVGAPRRPGQQVLGVADIPFVCFVGGGGFFSSPVPLHGLRMQIVGTSP